MSALIDKLTHHSPALWVEVGPPRGINPEPLLRRLSALVGHADAINLTDNSLGKVKMSGGAFASIIKLRLGLPVVVNFSCRDRNRFALKSDLLGAAALGIDAIVALTGDKIPPDDPSGARGVHDLDAFALLKMVGDLNRGDTGEGKSILKMLPNIVVGAVANPNRKNIEREFEMLKRKAEAGAKFVITQPIFEADTARRFLERANALGLKTVFGILPVKREAMGAYMKKNIADLGTVAGHLDKYAGMSEEQVRRKSIEENLALMKSISSGVAGFNIMSGGGPSLAIELALEFTKWRMASGKTRTR
ncbi:MAG TPA: methylenetetrahydrofolate reductase [Candidatus Binataceae bacterium]|nr:methylenetetrahydrofolate reductase [Candidatus Binataceae bacterium]